MADRFFVQWLDAELTRLAWRPRDAAAGDLRIGSVDDFARLATDAIVTLFVPTEDVLSLTLDNVPAAAEQKLRAAVPFMVEDQVAAPLETLHVAHGNRTADGTIQVAVVNDQRMSAWTEPLLDAGLNVDEVFPDALLLPCAPETWSAWSDGERVLVRFGEDQVSAFDLGAAAVLLPGLLSVQQQPAKVLGFSPLEPFAEAARHAGLEFEASTSIAQPLALADAAQVAGINLAQGRFLPRRSHGVSRWSLVATAALLALTLGSYLGFQARDLKSLRAASTDIEQQIEANVRRHFPEISKVRVAVVQPQVEQILKQLQAGGLGDVSFFELYAAAVQEIGQREGAELSTISFRSDTLELGVSLGEISQLEAIKDALVARGLQVEIRSADTADEGVSGRLRIRPS